MIKYNELGKFIQSQRITRKEFAEIVGLAHEKVKELCALEEVSAETLELCKTIYYSRKVVGGLKKFKMPIILSGMSHKGGVAKTTSNVNLAYSLADMGYHVLLVDAEEQANATSSLVKPGFGSGHIDVFTMITNQLDATVDYPMSDGSTGCCIVPTGNDNIDIICGTKQTRYLEYQLAKMEDNYDYPITEYLNHCLSSLMVPDSDGDFYYDFIIIDAPPTLGKTTEMIMHTCNKIYIVTTLDTYSASLVADFIDVLKATDGDVAEEKLLGIVFTMVEENLTLSKDISDAMTKLYGKDIMRELIHRDSVVGKSQSEGKSVARYSGTSRAAKDYVALRDAIINKLDFMVKEDK